ncbi:MAG: HAMP domain-containing protein [Planctomycetota bacterium]|nr:MAG: HAMP domain-containing protein [Planctomycetota bacterium]
MGSNLKVFTKGLILIAIPLLFQLGFLALFLQVRQQDVAAHEASARSERVNAEAENTFRILVEAQNGQRGYVITGDTAFTRPHAYAREMLPKQLEILRGLVSDPQQQSSLERIAEHGQELLEFLGTYRARVRGEERPMDAALIRNGQELMTRLREEVNTFLQRQAEMDAGRRAGLRVSRQKQDWMLAIGIGLSVVLLLGAAAVFSRSISARLRVLAENAQRLAEERELPPPVGGRDEIGRVDEAFHATADVLRRRSAALVASNRELQDFAAIASHDLQEPLRKVEAFGERLQSRCGAALGEPGRDYLERMLASAARMRALIHDLLEFSRVTTRGQGFTRVDLAQVAHAVVSDLEARIQQVGGNVELGPLPVIDADGLQMRQLLQNLISNGLKFHQPGAPPMVRVEGEIVRGSPGRPGVPAVCRIRVQDHGIGFEEVYLDRIFEPFQRLHGRHEYEGTGIGLAICRKIVHRHNGHITARSTPGQGATFVVTLPVAHTEGADPWTSTEDRSPS